MPTGRTRKLQDMLLAAADVLRRVDHSGRDEQDVAGLERDRRLPIQLILQHVFEKIDDLFARMRVPGRATPGAIETIVWMASRPGVLRSCRWRSLRVTPGCCAYATLVRAPAASSAAAAMIRVVIT
jgi:hypothetical protein